MERYHRQLDFLNPREVYPSITLIGAGGIGSHVGLVLAKMGLPFAVYDDDRVELHNLSNQVYTDADLGLPKVQALTYLAWDQGGVEIQAYPSSYENQPLGELVISGVDSIPARRRIWHQVRTQRPGLYIDGRMGGEVVTIFAVDPRDPSQVERYSHSIRPGIVAEELSCTGQAIAYNLFLCAAAIGKMVQAYLTKQSVPNEFMMDLKNYYGLWSTWWSSRETSHD